MNSLPQSWAEKVMTVRGLIDADDLGITSPHEHLVVRHQGPLVDVTDADLVAEELLRFAAYGGRTVVDMTNVGLARDIQLIKHISQRTSVQVVMGTGYYKDAWLPAYVHGLSTEEMTSIMVREILEGVDGVHAGVIGEVGVSRPTTATEERSLAAAARAQRITGAAINVHFDIGGPASEYHHAVDILESEGADLTRVVLDHFICRPDELDLVQSLTARGCLVEFDLFGQEKWSKINDLTGDTPPEVQVASLYWFIAAGLIEHILIAQDIANLVCLRKYGGYGYSHILKNLVPQIRAAGISDDQLHTLLVENSRRLFPFRVY